MNIRILTSLGTVGPTYFNNQPSFLRSHSSIPAAAAAVNSFVLLHGRPAALYSVSTWRHPRG
jgi:hypothetical protein